MGKLVEGSHEITMYGIDSMPLMKNATPYYHTYNSFKLVGLHVQNCLPLNIFVKLINNIVIIWLRKRSDNSSETEVSGAHWIIPTQYFWPRVLCEPIIYVIAVA